jgi:hypothetical protein
MQQTQTDQYRADDYGKLVYPNPAFATHEIQWSYKAVKEHVKVCRLIMTITLLVIDELYVLAGKIDANNGKS